MLLRPQEDFHALLPPGAADALLVIEVADSSRDYDVEIKTPLYAAANVPEYWILDLTENRFVRHVEPSGASYESVQHHASSDVVAPGLLSHCRVRVGDLLGL